MIKKNILKLTLQYVQKIQKVGIPIEAAFVFGSNVKGKAHQGSDIDLCIVSPKFGKDRQGERVLLLNLREGDSEIIEPHPYSLQDFNNKFDPLSQEIRKTGFNILTL